MSSEGVMFGLFMIVVVTLLVALPLFSRAQADPLADKQRERLQLYYERVLRNLRDLDEDHALGKIEEDAYAEERAVWVDRGVQVLKALDVPTERAMIAPTSADDVAVDQAIDDAIEAAIEKYRAQNKVAE